MGIERVSRRSQRLRIDSGGGEGRGVTPCATVTDNKKPPGVSRGLVVRGNL